jgi:transposase
MTLTKTQRDFLIKQLGATPRKKKLLQVRTDEEKKTDKYLELEKKALKSVAELEGLIGASELVVETRKRGCRDPVKSGENH